MSNDRANLLYRRFLEIFFDLFQRGGTDTDLRHGLFIELRLVAWQKTKPDRLGQIVGQVHEAFEICRFVQIVMMTDDSDRLGSHVSIDQQELSQTLMPRYIPHVNLGLAKADTLVATMAQEPCRPVPEEEAEDEFANVMQ